MRKILPESFNSVLTIYRKMPRRRVVVSGPLARPRLVSFAADAALRADWQRIKDDHGAPNPTRQKVIQHFEQFARLEGLEHADALPLYYTAMLTRCGLAESTAKTYLHYVCSGLGLRGPTVRYLKQVADKKAGRATPRRPTYDPTDDEIVHIVTLMDAGPERRSLALSAVTGARTADTEKLQDFEVAYDPDEDALVVAWSEMKQRKNYRSRCTVHYPTSLSAAIQRAFRHILMEFNQVEGPPCQGVTCDSINRAIRAVPGANVLITSRSLRVSFVRRAAAYVQEHSLAPDTLCELTGHHSNAMAKAVYQRHAAIQRAKRLKARRSN